MELTEAGSCYWVLAAGSAVLITPVVHLYAVAGSGQGAEAPCDAAMPQHEEDIGE